jgi:RHS repeat-associated protein
VAYTAFGDPVTPDGQGGWRVGFPPGSGGVGEPLGTRYQYDGGWGYESGLISLFGEDETLPPVTLQHVGWRWYQPSIGRFVQRDPVGISGGMNVYLYWRAVPLVGVDPLGLLAWYDVVIWVTGGQKSWLDDEDTVRTAQATALAVGTGITAGLCVGVPLAAGGGLVGAGVGAGGAGAAAAPHIVNFEVLMQYTTGSGAVYYVVKLWYSNGTSVVKSLERLPW